MRYYIPVVLALCAMLVAGAQEHVLRLSKSVTAVKITDPARQMTTFASLLTYLDGMVAGAPTEELGAQLHGILQLREQAAGLAKVPGVNAKGDFWIVSMPPTPEGESTVKAIFEPDAEGNVDQEMMRAAIEQSKPHYLIVPLTDAKAFEAYRQGLKEPIAKVLSGEIRGKHVITFLEGIPGKPYTGVDLDLKFLTKRDVAMSYRYGTMPLPVGEVATAFGSPVEKLQDDTKNNVQRMELGIAMKGTVLSVETFTIPVPDSPFAKSLAAPAPARHAVEYAGYLPDALAYCAAGDAMLPGVPGTGKFALQMCTGFLNMGLSPERAKSLGENLDALSAQCSQGRAIGVTKAKAAPGSQGFATLIAVYHLTDPPAAGKALEKVINEIQMAGTEIMGEAMQMTVQPAEKVGGVPIDLVKVTVTMPAPPPGVDAPPPPPPMVFDLRAAILDDKLLITAGAQDGKEMAEQEKQGRLGLSTSAARRGEEMANLITRIQQKKKTGFTSSARFQAMKKTMPAEIRGFDSLVTLDLARALGTMIPIPDTKANVLKGLSIFPPQSTSVSMYQEVRGGHLRNEITVPNEQLQFIFTAMNALQSMMQPPAGPSALPAT